MRSARPLHLRQSSRCLQSLSAIAPQPPAAATIAANAPSVSLVDPSEAVPDASLTSPPAVSDVNARSYNYKSIVKRGGALRERPGGERERRRSSKAAAPHRAPACSAVQTDSRHIVAAREQETLSREAARTRRSAHHAVSKGARAPTGRHEHHGARCTSYSRSVGRLSRASLRHSGRVAYSIAHTICAAGESAVRPNGTRGSGPVRRSQAAATTHLTNEPFQSDRRFRFARSRSEQSVVGV